MNLLAAKNNLEAVNLVINLQRPALMYTCKYIYNQFVSQVLLLHLF